MKKVLAGLCLLMLTKAATAQQPMFNRDELVKELAKAREGKLKKPGMVLPQISNGFKVSSSPADTAWYVASNNLGDIYRLPQDNMPCLKAPNVEPGWQKSPVPQSLVTAIPFANPMPNLYNGNRLVLVAPKSN